MKLLTKEIRKALPPLKGQEGVSDPIVFVKFFTPWTSWTWLATEFDGKDTFFGFVIGLEPEWGYFSLSELESVRGPWGLRIERDLHFGPMPMSEAKRLMRANPPQKKIWMGSKPGKCQLCQQPIKDVFIDGKTAWGPWAIMCKPCWLTQSGRLGMGFGQMYDARTMEKIKGNPRGRR